MALYDDEEDDEINLEGLNLTDLIPVETLQKMQDAFSEMVRMASLTTDNKGVPITKGSNFSRLCTDFCRASEIGRKRCEYCDINGAEIALSKGGPVSYYCHANLVDFAAPIMIGDVVIGSFIGGQVLPEPPDLNKMREIAKEIGVDVEEFVNAAKETTIVPVTAIDRATSFIYSFAQILSEIAYKAYKTKTLSEKAQQAADAKADFLANMSHEIRTPMNAVLGMATVALRENLPDNARDCIKQIIASGRFLLTIINDILDYSKIESGKMDIVDDYYDPFSLVNDLANIVTTKIGDKNLEFIVDANPNFPREIIGDKIRIEQVITNLVNNAVKFTNEGKVCLHLDFVQLGDESDAMIELQIGVEDTGIGIKKEDMKRIFESFQQVDTKRNRNIEGTGLGLAISKRLVTMMKGELKVQSQYGKGSTFSFAIPQKVSNFEPCFNLGTEQHICGVIAGNADLQEQLEADLTRIGQMWIFIDMFSVREKIENKEIDYLFIEHAFFSERFEKLAEDNPDLNVIVIVPLGTSAYYPHKNVRVIKKPVYSLVLASIFQNIDVEVLLGEGKQEDFFFTAPDAQVLIVDDNETNITVAKGLLEPYKLQIDAAFSGQECLKKIKQKKYDLIFMDHMMPGMDGVDTTAFIRRDFPDYADVPIIALTANAVAGTRNLFFKVGMNDFVPKPIELGVIVPTLKRWLPAEKVIIDSSEEIARKQANNLSKATSKIVIKNLDTAYALNLFGGKEDVFWQSLHSWYKNLPKKIDAIRNFKANQDWKSYTIDVHAMKSSSRQIGAIELANLAEELEMAGNNLNTDLINEKTDALLELAESYLPILKPYFAELEEVDDDDKKFAPREVVSENLSKAIAAFKDLDLDAAESIIKEFGKYKFAETELPLFSQLKDAVENIDMAAGEEIANKWLSVLCDDKTSVDGGRKRGLLQRCTEILGCLV